MSASSERTRRYREQMRKRGLRPVQVWVPDTRSPEFAERVRRECEEINRSDAEEGIMEWLESVSILNEPDETW